MMPGTTYLDKHTMLVHTKLITPILKHLRQDRSDFKENIVRMKPYMDSAIIFDLPQTEYRAFQH